MFVNLTNHPVERWSVEQRAAAHDNDVRDYPFPNVNPNFTQVEVFQLAQDTFTEVMKLNPDTVLVQGEMTLTFHLVNLFKGAGVKTVCATSQREVVETVNDNGETVKNVVFRFVQFREY